MAAVGQGQRNGALAAAGVQYIAGELALLDEGGELRLRFAEAPRRSDTLAQLGFAAVHGFEVEIC